MGDMRNYGEKGVIATIVLFLSSQIVAYVPPPTNVTLSCRNFEKVLYWNYSDSSLESAFRVKIGTYFSSSPSRPIWVHSPNLQADVSFLDNTDEYYRLTVTAVSGGNESDPSPDLYFSYFKDFSLGQTCALDFPSVNVTVQSDATVGFRFLHPSLSYPQMLREEETTKKKKKRRLSEFTYTVTLLTESPMEHEFSCDTRVCEEKLPVDGSEEGHCVRMEGELNHVAVKATQDYCAQALVDPHPSRYLLLYILCPLLAFVLVSCLVIWMVYRKWTSGSSPLPSFMTQVTDKFNPLRRSPLTVERTPVSQVLSTSPGTTPLLPTDAEEFTFADTPTEAEGRLRIGVMRVDRSVSSGLEERLEDGEGYASGKVLDAGEGEGGEGEGPAEGNSFVQDNRGPSGYEQRPDPVTVEMAQGDQVEGYRG